MFRLITVAAALITGLTPAFAAQDQNAVTNEKLTNATNELGSGDKKLNGRSLQEQYGGIVTDQTITVAGQDFYQYFVALWQDQPLNERYSIAIRERPSARWGNKVWVEYANSVVFETVLPSNRSNIKAISAQAVEIAYRNVVDAETQRLFFRDQDIGPDEM